MKQLLVLLLILNSNLLFGQDSKEDAFQFSLIDSVSGAKSELYVYAKEWMANEFVSSKAVIESEDKEAGKIIGKAYFKIPVKATLGNRIGDDNIKFTITIDVKDNKYRCIISNFFHTGGDYKGSADGGLMDKEKPSCGTFLITKKRWNEDKRIVKEKSLALLESFKTAMTLGKDKSNF